MLTAVFIALFASHGYLLIELFVQHILERALWRGSVEEKMMEDQELEVREARVQASTASLRALNGEVGNGVLSLPRIVVETTGLKASDQLFEDLGLSEIQSSGKME
jgi:hypothetical protein